MAAVARGLNDRFGPSLVTVPFQAVIFGFYGRQFLPSAGAGVLLSALLGVLWALLLGFGAQRIARRAAWQTRLANAPLFLGIVATGLMIGGGFMYGAMMTTALADPSLTASVLSALMQPAVPFFIALNSTLELAVISLIVCWNWEIEQRRRTLILLGVAAYFVMRIWTYFVFAETRLEISRARAHRGGRGLVQTDPRYRLPGHLAPGDERLLHRGRVLACLAAEGGASGSESGRGHFGAAGAAGIGFSVHHQRNRVILSVSEESRSPQNVRSLGRDASLRSA